MANMKEVSRHVGVSVATVSNVITGKRVVSPKVRERVLASIKELDYRVNPIARGLKTQRTATIGVVLPGITKLYFQQVLNGIIHKASLNGYSVTVMNSNYDFETERRLVHSLVSSYAEGIILDSCAPVAEAGEWAASLAGGDMKMPPVVSIESQMNPHAISSVSFDNARYSAQVTQHLIDLGRKRILFVSGPIFLEHEEARHTGYLNCLKQNSIKPVDALQAFGDYLSESGYKLVRKKLKEKVRIDAVQASNDQAAIGALKALKEAGLRVPEDIALCGFDNVFPSTLVTPAITTVDVSGYQLGHEATRLLLRLIKEPSLAPLQRVLDARLLIRESSQLGAVSSWDLADW